MDSADDSTIVFTSKISKSFHHRSGSERIKTSGWFIEEDQTWISDKFNTNWSTFTFSTWDTFDKGTSDSGILTLGQLKSLDDKVDTFNLLMLVTG